MRSLLDLATKFAINLAIPLGLLTAGIISSFPTSVKAQEIFDNIGIRFDADTIVEFEFVESHGAYRSSFGVINLDTGEKTPLLVEVKASDLSEDVNNPSSGTNDAGRQNDFLGSPGNAVPNPLAEFLFKANNRYAFYLESTYNGRPAGIVYSVNSANPGNNQQVQFQGNITNLGNGGIMIRWDDTGSILVRTDKEDRDFDDFIIRSGGRIPCPYEGNNNIQQQSQLKQYKIANNLDESTSCKSSEKVQ